MNLSHKIFTRSTPKDLACLDAFYNVTVSQLCTEARRQYCVNLMGRLREDLRKTNCRDEMRQIKLHILAARTELKNLTEPPSG